VVAGLGAGAYGFNQAPDSFGLFAGPAHAQVGNEVRPSQQPAGFADIVEKVKSSVISVKVNIAEKVSRNDDRDDSPFQPGSPMERSSAGSAASYRRACAAVRVAASPGRAPASSSRPTVMP